ncbi:MAG: hypothetical protein ACI8PT_001868 [Gammaproteobacteria bacterium]|jgi:hypothetical protein
MHVILALLGTIVTVLILLNRVAQAGIDLGGLNPFLWRHRRQWRQAYEGSPVHQLGSPMEATALLMAATAKAEGDISAEQKYAILSAFQDEFHPSKKKASSLLLASTYILGTGEDVHTNVEKFLALSREAFTPAQADSCLAMLERVATMDGPIVGTHSEILRAARMSLKPHAPQALREIEQYPNSRQACRYHQLVPPLRRERPHCPPPHKSKSAPTMRIPL